MMRARVLSALLASAVVLTIPVGAQTRPNLVGKWTLVVDKSVPPQVQTHGREITMALEGQTLTLTQIAMRYQMSFVPGAAAGGPPPTLPPGEESPYSLAYILDGAEHPTPIRTPVGGAGMTSQTMTLTQESTYRAIWTRDQLIIMTRATSRSGQAPSPISRVTRRAFSIDAEGQLIVDNITVADPVPDGPTQAAPAPTKGVYRKSS
jgi:hypothetical protein